MKYKTIFLLLLLTTLFANLSFANLNADTSNLKIVAEEVTPEPVEPGQDVTVKARIYNYGNDIAKDVNVKLNAKYPFYLKTQSSNFADYNDLCIYCSKDNTYYLTVDANAVSGIYPIEFEIYADKGNAKKTQSINIIVIGIPDIVFEAEPVKKTVMPNEKFTAQLTFKNIGTGIARNIKITPQSTNFIKLGSGLDVIEEINPKEERTINISFNVAETLTPNTYNIPVQIRFTDERSNKYNISENFGIKVVHGATLGLQNLKITPQNNIKEGDEVEIQIRIENTGNGNAQNVKVVLDSGMEGNKIAYLGRIEKNDDEPTIFTLTAQNSGRIKNNLKITFNDDFGEHELNEEFFINIEENKKQNSMTIVFACLGLTILAAFLGGLKRKKMNQ